MILGKPGYIAIIGKYKIETRLAVSAHNSLNEALDRHFVTLINISKQVICLANTQTMVTFLT